MKRRKDKIQLLKDILAGKRPIGEILPPITRIWEADEINPELFYCKKEALMKRKGETLPDEIGRHVINIIMTRSNNSSLK